MTRAADMLHLTQPTLSRQIAPLEEELGAPLFIRGRHLALTEAGMKLRRRAEEIMQLMDKIEIEFKEQEEVAGVISIRGSKPKIDEKAVLKRVPKGTEEANKKALQAGKELIN